MNPVPDPDHPAGTPGRAIQEPAGFSRAFAAVVDVLWLVAIGILRDRHLADDAVQDAGLIAFQKRSQFQTGTSFRAWTSTIVRHTALNLARKHRRHTGTGHGPETPNHDALPAPPDRHPTPTVNAIGRVAPDQHAFDDAVVHALDELSDTARACLLLKTVRDLSYAEIAEVLEIPEGTAMSHVSRARAKLRQQLAAHPAAPQPTPPHATDSCASSTRPTRSADIKRDKP
ncbi:MAG: RNA polymerase sigma factor [Planctomycetota bacterium]